MGGIPMDLSTWKNAFEPYLSAPELLASIVAGIAIFALYLVVARSHKIKERLELLRSQRDELNAKLTEGKAKLLELEKQIAVGASSIALSAEVVAAATLLRDMQIIIDNMGGTLDPSSGVYGAVVLHDRLDEPSKITSSLLKNSETGQ
jgi:hypothetical protein